MESRHTSSPLFTVTGDDHAGWVVVISIVFFIYSLLSVTAKLIIQFRLVTLQAFDYFIVVGAVILLVQTVLTVASCSSGLGKHIRALDLTDLTRYNQASSSQRMINFFYFCFFEFQGKPSADMLVACSFTMRPLSWPSSQTAVRKSRFVCSSAR